MAGPTSDGSRTTRDLGTGMPYFLKSSFPWYSKSRTAPTDPKGRIKVAKPKADRESASKQLIHHV